MRRSRPRTTRLTRRELEVLSLAVEGYTAAEMAQRLFVSPNTVKKHLAHIFEKCGVRSRVQLANWWSFQARTQLSEVAAQGTASEASPRGTSGGGKRLNKGTAVLTAIAAAVLVALVLFPQDRSATPGEGRTGLLSTATRATTSVAEGCRCPDDVLIAVRLAPGTGAVTDCPPGCATPPAGAPQ